MLKKITASIIALMMAFSVCACDEGGKTESQTTSSVPVVSESETQAETAAEAEDETTPEDIAEDFMRAIYKGDLDAFFAHIPEFTYDVLLTSENIEYTEGEDKGAAVYNYFKSVMEEEPEEYASEVTIETKISEELDKGDYLDSVRQYYLPEGFITESDLEKVEDAVYVLFNADVKYASGKEFSLTDYKSAIPCVKIDGKWYADYFYLLMIPVKMETPETMQEKVPVQH